jgi:hypothetical protein
MISLKHLFEETERMSKLRRTIDELFQLWRRMPDGERKEALKNRIDAIGRKFERVRDADPYEGDKHAFMKHHYTGHIPSHAYEKYEGDGGLQWLGDKTKFPVLLTAGTFGKFHVEFRQSGEALRYIKRDSEGNIVRDEKGMALDMTPDEVRAENLPEKDQTIVAFVGDHPIGFASNEFGSVGVWVEKAYQKSGIGVELLDLHIQQRPTFKTKRGKIGQMTIAGQSMVGKYYDRMVKRHGPGWFKKMKVG